MTRTMGPLRKLALLGVIAACATLGATVAAAASSVLPAGPSNRQYRTTCVKPKLKPRTRQKRNRSADAKAVAPRSRPCKRPGDPRRHHHVSFDDHPLPDDDSSDDHKSSSDHHDFSAPYNHDSSSAPSTPASPHRM